MKILSIIIPSYNSAKFLDKCIPSFLDEAVIGELDIIVVNDGSADETSAAARKYCDRYPDSIRLIEQENKGHGGALNTGCAAAVGKFLKVIDADDWVETGNLRQFLDCLKNCDADVVLTHYYTRDISTGETREWKSFPENFGKSYTFDQIMPNWKCFDNVLTFHGITYNTAFYHKHAFRLSEHVFYEDHEFATIPCCYAGSIVPLDLFIYDYRIGDVQQSVSDANQLKRLSHVQTVLNRFLTEWENLGLPADSAGRTYYAMKARGLLLSYITTVMLVEPDKKRGRQLGAEMMARFRQNMPKAYELAVKQYQVFSLMNRFGVSKQTWEKILRSDFYRALKQKK